MGRIAWFDALSRKRYQDSNTFTNNILLPLQSQLLSTTWMHERIQCDSQQALNRTAMYFEYPSMVSMLLYRIKYGIELDMDMHGSTRLQIEPFTTSSFSYHINNMDIEYAPNSFSLVLDRSASASSSSFSTSSLTNSEPMNVMKLNLENICYFHLSPMEPNTVFTVSSGSSLQEVSSNELGELNFNVTIVNGIIQVTAIAVGSSQF